MGSCVPSEQGDVSQNEGGREREVTCPGGDAINNECLFHASEILVISHEISIFVYEEITREREDLVRLKKGRCGAREKRERRTRMRRDDERGGEDHPPLKVVKDRKAPAWHEHWDLILIWERHRKRKSEKKRK